MEWKCSKCSFKRVVVEQATFENGDFDIVFEATLGDSIELIWIDGDWSEEVSFEIIDGDGNTISSGDYGDTLEGENIFAFCLPALQIGLCVLTVQATP